MKTSIFKYDLKFTGISTIWFIAVIDFSFNIKVPHLSLISYTQTIHLSHIMSFTGILG